jgi:hypothetical protein
VKFWILGLYPIVLKSYWIYKISGFWNQAKLDFWVGMCCTGKIIRGVDTMYESQWEDLAIGVGGEDIIPPALIRKHGRIPEMGKSTWPGKSEVKLDGFMDCSVFLRGGIYLLKYRQRIVYIGQSKCFLSRINTHRANRGQKTPVWVKAIARGILFDQILVLPVPPEQRNALEAKLIAHHQPQYNVRLKNPTPPKLPLPPLKALVDFVIPPPAPISESFVRRAL